MIYRLRVMCYALVSRRIRLLPIFHNDNFMTVAIIYYIYQWYFNKKYLHIIIIRMIDNIFQPTFPASVYRL